MKKNFKIEKNIPIPQRGRKTLYPLGEMEVGDSFVFETSYTRAAQSRACCAINAWKRHSPLPDKDKRIYITRKVDDLLRIWRIQ